MLASLVVDNDRFADIPDSPRPCRSTIHHSSLRVSGYLARPALNR